MRFPYHTLSTWGRSGLVAFALAAGVSPAHAGVLVTPQAGRLACGQALTFQAHRQVPDGKHDGAAPSSQEAGWTWALADGAPGFLDPARGVYLAPNGLADTRLVKVRATHRGTGETGEATLLVVPDDLATVMDLMGNLGLQETSELHAQAWPFLELETGARWLPGAQVEPWATEPPPDDAPLKAGWGLPFTFRWQPQPGAEAVLLSYREGNHVVRRDVTGLDHCQLTFRDEVAEITVESLRRHPDRPGGYQSSVQSHDVRFRGMVLHAGNPAKAAAAVDGKGLEGRFREPMAMVRLPWQGDPEALLVADGHAIRLVSKGDVRTLYGHPDRPGFADGKGADARFNGPTFLALRTWDQPDGGQGWRCAVADSGNHVIRMLHEDGTVTTLAGAPGQAGYRDDRKDLRAARFNRPHGIAFNRSGNLFICDRGNHVIRFIHPDGGVFTYAGAGKTPGTADGGALEARFTDLKGLCLEDLDEDLVLHVTDGHAVREIIHDGDSDAILVTTALGSVTTPGSLELPYAEGGEGYPEPRMLQPCLNDPWDVKLSRDHILHISDRGNHAIRAAGPMRRQMLETLVGPAAVPEVRCGLLSKGRPGPLEPHHAAVLDPRGLLALDGFTGDTLVASGSCLTQLLHTYSFPAAAEVVCPTATRDLPCTIQIGVAAQDRLAETDLSGQPLTYTVQFVEADGTAQEDLAQGPAVRGLPETVTATFTQPGAASVLVHFQADDGTPHCVRQTLIVK
jgi:hypothetical protein